MTTSSGRRPLTQSSVLQYMALYRLGFRPEFDCSAHLYGFQTNGPFWTQATAPQSPPKEGGLLGEEQ